MKQQIKRILLVIALVFVLIGALFLIAGFVNGFHLFRVLLGAGLIGCGIVVKVYSNDYSDP